MTDLSDILFNKNPVEYVYNDGADTAAGAANVANTATGIEGATINAINSTSDNTVTTFRVNFSTATQGDVVELQVQFGGADRPWVPASQTQLAAVRQAGRRYGMELQILSSFSANVIFGNAGSISGGATYDSNGISWAAAGGGGGTLRWRVVKRSQ